MKIDSAIKTFYEKYNREAIQSIDNISNDYGLNISDSIIKAFNINESFDKFKTYLEGYTSYKINNKDDKIDQTAIKERTKVFIDTKIFESCDIKYNQLPKFITGYIEGVNSLCETVDNIKREMIDANIKAEDIGDINEFADMFMDKLHESFDPSMDRILWASGYNAKQRLSKENTDKPKAPIFL